VIPTAVRTTSLHELDDAEEPLQTGFWAVFKEHFGWDSHPLIVEYRDLETTLLVLSRPLAPGLRMAYVPLGPPLEEPELHREDLLTELGLAVAPHLPRDVFLIRFDLPWYRLDPDHPEPLGSSRWLRRSGVDVQPPSTVVVDIRPDEDEILAAMKPKWRYNIGLASRRGVRVVEDRGGRLSDWYRLHAETAARDRITIHSEDYYRTLFDLSRTYGAGAPEFHLLLAEAEGRIIAGIIVALRRPRAWYPYGASSNEGRNLMPNHALQWRAIQLARAGGCESYDLYGIPPADDPHHPMHGLYQFKTGFGGAIVHRYGCYDVVLHRLRYGAYRRAERMRDWYYKRARKTAISSRRGR
jgi:lipid II:glycine glycyltransferase (peptidoglycan interpeptide bridge formation enzyme)